MCYFITKPSNAMRSGMRICVRMFVAFALLPFSLSPQIALAEGEGMRETQHRSVLSEDELYRNRGSIRLTLLGFPNGRISANKYDEHRSDNGSEKSFWQAAFYLRVFPSLEAGEEVRIRLSFDSTDREISNYILRQGDTPSIEPNRLDGASDAVTVASGEEGVVFHLTTQTSGNAIDDVVTVRIDEIRVNDLASARIGEIEGAGRQVSLRFCSPPDYETLSRKIGQLLHRYGGIVCRSAENNDFASTRKILEEIGERFIGEGEAITVEEALPYIDCALGGTVDNLLLASFVGRSYDNLSNVYLYDIIHYFATEACDQHLLQKIVGCKIDRGSGCNSFMEHLRQQQAPEQAREYPDRAKGAARIGGYLQTMLNRSGGEIRDVQWCRHVVNEPYYCGM